MNDLTNIPGLYGKIPVRGDFVTRRLTAHFVETWDKWLQNAISVSKEQLGSKWLEIYLISPIWHFILSPGICGTIPWTGILMPSVDKVGRYFPLTFAVSFDPAQKLSEFFMGAADWFEQMEQLALSALEDNLDLTELDRELQARTLPESSAHQLTTDDHLIYTNNEGKLAFQMSMDKPEQMTDAFAQLGCRLLKEAHPTYSLWNTTGSESMKPCLRVYSNLPPWDAFSELLIGRQERTGEESKAIDPPLPAKDDRPVDHCVLSSIETVEKQRIQWRSCAGTTVGQHRKINEDAYLECPEIGLWAVADGMGGHSAGDVASKTVIDALGTLMPTGNLDSFTAYTTECLRTVNTDLLAMAAKLGDDRIIGTTIVVMLAVGWRCAVIWAGDSRLYQFRDDMLTQLTCDHSLASELSLQEIIKTDASEKEKVANVVTRALGAEADLAFDAVTFEARVGDLYLLCSDGLIKEVRHQEIADILRQKGCRRGMQQLIDLSLQRGARDNVTVVVAHAGQTG